LDSRNMRHAKENNLPIFFSFFSKRFFKVAKNLIILISSWSYHNFGNFLGWWTSDITGRTQKFLELCCHWTSWEASNQVQSFKHSRTCKWFLSFKLSLSFHHKWHDGNFATGFKLGLCRILTSPHATCNLTI
jgi:hypothetical protein